MRVDCDDCGKIFEESDLVKGPYDNIICVLCLIVWNLNDTEEQLALGNIHQEAAIKTINTLVQEKVDLAVDRCNNADTQPQEDSQ